MVTPNTPGSVGWTLNAAWPDYNTYIRVRGFSNDGRTQDGGCCAVNCSNVNQFYAFHTGGVNTLRGDGSVRFLRNVGGSKGMPVPPDHRAYWALGTKHDDDSIAALEIQ